MQKILLEEQKKVMVDIDKNEVNKKDLKINLKINVMLNTF